jgi:hypothetical protein
LRRVRRRLERAKRWLPPLVVAVSVASCSDEREPASDASSAAAPVREQDPVAPAPEAIPDADADVPIRFTDVTTSSGIDFTMTSGRKPATEIVEVKGGGLALIDYDNDGRLDLFVPNGATLRSPTEGPGCRLFKNLGGLSFRDVTEEALLTFNRWGMGVAVGDYDGDGFDDVYITCFGRNALLRNQGDGTFADVTDAADVGDEAWGTGCAWSDLDGDGDLDLYVANFLHFDPANPPPHTTFKDVEVFAGPVGLPPTADVLYENLGDGTFRNVTAESGCGAVSPMYGLNVAILDFDGDGKPDIFVGNDSSPNFLFQNLGGMRFKDIGMQSGLAANGEGAFQATMGIAIADVNGNGLPDVFTSNFSSDTNTLHINLARMIFEDRTQLYGLGSVSTTFLGWATAFYDFGHDGWEDLIVFNGHVYPHATRATLDSDLLQPPLLFERRGRRFERVAAEESGPWLDEAYCDRSAVFGDLDSDGDVDIIVGELNGPVRVLRNDRNGGAWLSVELQDNRPGVMNHRAIGSLVDVVEGERTHRRWVYSGGSFQSSSSLAAHFGFEAPPAKPKLRVIWPDGEVSAFDSVPLNSAIVVERNEAGAGVSIRSP